MENNLQEKEIIDLIKAKVPIIQIISYETLRIHGMLVGVVQELERDLYIWNRVNGLKKWEDGTFVLCEDDPLDSPGFVLADFEKKENAIFLLEDFHSDLTEDNPRIIRQLRNIAINKGENRTLFLLQPFQLLPRELEKEVHVFDLPYPSKEDIESIYESVCEEYNVDKVKTQPNQDLINAALGLTIMEAHKAFALAYIKSGSLSNLEIPYVIKEKEHVIKKSGYLEYYHPKEKLKDIGGLGNLKEWLKKRGRGFDESAIEFGLKPPKGVLLLGIPGTGKSLIAKAIGNLWKFPLLRLDMGKIFGGIVGESEKNIRGALKIAEAIAPSILWIDEIEKGMAGMSSSGSSDGGTTARVLGTFLTWMQEKEKSVFVVATANDISLLPPELLRKGRVDEIFFVDLPTEDERLEIIKIHLKTENKLNDEELSEIAKITSGFSGAELEESIMEALYRAYDKTEQLSVLHIKAAISNTRLLSQTMYESIIDMRAWAAHRALPASKNKPEIINKPKDSIPQLKTEKYNNPFIKKGTK
jgi:DNA polymerase III delta prime subunit